MPLNSLATERLRLRQWQEEDFQPFAELNADARVMEYFPSVLDREASDAMARRCHSLIARRGWGFWAVEEKVSERFIGFVGLHIPQDHLPFQPCVEIGWRLAAPHWGKGYATEAAQCALKAGFETLGLDEIVSFTTLGNARSKRVMKKLGMREDPERFEHPALPVGHPLRRHCLFRLSSREWQDKQGGHRGLG